jgi:lysophospholipid acyltransferase (LPLAT)-like uncharacterized protein
MWPRISRRQKCVLTRSSFCDGCREERHPGQCRAVIQRVPMSSVPPNDQHSSAYQQVTRSGRRLTRTRQLLYAVGLPILLGIVRLFWSSYRFHRVVGDERLDSALREHREIIPCLWHQHLMAVVPYLLQKRAIGLKLGFMISPSVDGEAGAMAAQRIGGHIVRGSSNYTGARALRDFYLAVTKEEVSLLITPDGPRGPRYKSKSGALLIAQLTGKPIVPISYAASRICKFTAWDRFILPLPFARIAIAVGEPIKVPKVMKPAELESMQTLLDAKLNELFLQAKAELG